MEKCLSLSLPKIINYLFHSGPLLLLGAAAGPSQSFTCERAPWVGLPVVLGHEKYNISLCH